MNQLNHREKSLIRLLLDNKKDYITSNELADFCHVSIRTIKNDVKVLNDILKEYGGEIISEMFTGYKLIISDDLLFNRFLGSNNVLENTTAVNKPIYPYERVNYIIKKLLAIDYYISIDNLADELFVSRSTITSDMKEVRSRLEEYNLSIEAKPNYGIILEGDEINKRLCISEYYFHNDVETSFLASDNAMFVSAANKREIADVNGILKNVIDDNGISMTDASFQDMVIHVVISIRRYKFYNYVKIDNSKTNDIKRYKEYKAGVQLKNEIERWQNIILPDNESLYFTLHFHAKHINDSNELDVNETVQVNDLLLKFCSLLSSKYHFTYETNTTFEQFFKLHIPLMIQRIKTGMIIRNKDSFSIFSNYPFAAHVAYDLCQMIEEEYQVTVNSNEFAYLILYINLLLTKREKEKYDILLVCSSGRLGSVTIVNEIEDTLRGNIKSIEMCDYSKVDSVELEKYSLVFSTMDIPDIKSSVPIVKLDDNNPFSETIKSALDMYCLYNIDLEDFIKEKYFINNMSASDRYDVLKNISRLFVDSDRIYEGFCAKQSIVAETEKNIVFLNTNETIDEDFIFIVVLKKAIIWHKQWIQMVVWVNVRDNNIKRLQSCYYYLGKILKQENIIQRIAAMKKSEEFIHLLK